MRVSKDFGGVWWWALVARGTPHPPLPGLPGFWSRNLKGAYPCPTAARKLFKVQAVSIIAAGYLTIVFNSDPRPTVSISR